MRARFIFALVALFPLAALATLAQTDSVEWLAVDAGMIVSGTIASVKDSVITVKVTSTLKGSAYPTISFPSSSLQFASADIAQQAIKGKHEMLFFMAKDTAASSASDAVKEALDLTTARTLAQLRIISKSGNLLDHKDSIIEAVKTELAHNPGPAGGFKYIDVQPQLVGADKTVSYYSWSPTSSEVSVKVPAQ